MNEVSLKNAINEITTSNDKKIIYKLLVKIRTDIVKNESGIRLFYSCSGIKPLVSLLHKPYEQCIEVALSILGNCCTVEECCFEALDCKIIPVLISIIKNVSNKNIQSRGCRLLGNLAKYEKICKVIDEIGGTGQALSNIFDDTSNIGVQLMAVRLIRQLWNLKNFQYEFIIHGCVKKVMNILLENSKNKNPTSTISDPDTEDVVVYDPTCVTIRTHHGRDRIVSRSKFNELMRNIETNRNSISGYEVMAQEKKAPDDIFILPTGKEVIDLLNSILKCFQMFTSVQCSKIAEQLYADGHGYLCLVFLSRENSPYRSQSLKILSNLVSNAASRCCLGTADVIVLASELLISKNIVTPLDLSEIKHCIRIICLLTGDSCNRAKIRRSGALSELLKKSRLDEFSKEFKIILYAFYQFRFDQLSIDLLISEGLVEVLIKKLGNKIEEMCVDHIQEVEVDEKKIDEKAEDVNTSKSKRFKQNRDLSPLAFYDPQSPGSSSSGYASDYRRRPTSMPIYTNAGYPRSPSSSPSYSPNSSPINLEMETDFDSDTYSPVCSDAEDDECLKNDKILEEDIIMKNKNISDDFLSLLTECDDSNSYPPSDSEDISDVQQIETEKESENLDSNLDSYNNPIGAILTLLHNATMQNKYIPDLVKPETLTTLLTLSKLIPKPFERLSQILSNILRDSRNFKPILYQNFIFDLNEQKRFKHIHKNCKSCSEINLLADELMDVLRNAGESGYGRGEIAHFLLTGEKLIQKRAAIITTYIIRTPKILYKLLVECRAIDIVINTILTETENLSDEASLGLTRLSNNLKIGDGLYVRDRLQKTEMKTTVNYAEKQLNRDSWSNEIVTFMVGKDKEQRKIEFCQKILIESSDVFNSMFTSGFKESKNKEAHLSDVSEGGLKYFLVLLTVHVNGDDLNEIPFSDNMNSALEAYQLSDKYMLPEILTALYKIMKISINENSAIVVFEWSLQHLNQDMLDASMYFFLNADINGEKKVKLFRKAMNSKYSEEWKNLLIDHILAECKKGFDFKNYN